MRISNTIVALIFLALATSLAAQDPVTLSVKRYTTVDEETYLYEEGELGADGFYPTYQTVEVYDSATPRTRIALVSGYPVYSVSDWNAEVAETPSLATHFQLEPQTFNLEGESVRFITWIGASPVASVTPIEPKLINLSFRAVLPANGAIRPGFVISNGPTRVLLRAGGPALARFGVAGTLPDPRITLFQGTATVASNDNWAGRPTSDAAAASGGFPYVAGSKDAAMVVVLSPGEYTAAITGEPNTSGELLVEIYTVPQ